MEHLPQTPEFDEGLDNYIKPLSSVVSLLREPLTNFESPDAWFVGTRAAIIQLEDTYKEDTYWAQYDPQVLFTRTCTRLLKEAPGSPHAIEARWYLDSILKDAFELSEGKMSYQLRVAIEMEVDRRAVTNTRVAKEYTRLEEIMRDKNEALYNLSNMGRYLNNIRKKSLGEDNDPESSAWKLATHPHRQRDQEEQILDSDDTAANKRKALMRLAIGNPRTTIKAHYSTAHRAYSNRIEQLNLESITRGLVSE